MFTDWGERYHSDEFNHENMCDLSALQDKYMMGGGTGYDDVEGHVYEYDNYLHDFLYGKGAPLCHHVATATDIKANEANKRIYADTGKSPTVTTMGGGHREPKVLVVDKKYRKLTPRECMRLQGFTEEIIDKLLNAGISNSQLYKMCGNSFTLPVIIHNLQCLLDSGWPHARI